MPICKHQQIDFFLLINNVSDFEKMSIPFLKNNNLFLNSTFLFELRQSLTNLIVLAWVAYEQRYKLA